MHKMASVFYKVLLLCCAIHCCGGTANATRKLHLLTLLPYPNSNPAFSPLWQEGLNIIPALDLAARHVNQREGFLDGYELELIHRDGGCEILSTTLPSLVQGLFVNKNSIVGLVGPGCSVSTRTLLSTINTRNRTSLIAVHGGLSLSTSRVAFTNSFGILGLDYEYTKAMFALAYQSGWRNVAFMADSRIGNLLSRVKSEFFRAFPDGRVVSSVIVSDFNIPLDALRDSSARVIIVFTSRDLARTIMCLALRSGMLYPDYQWVFVGRAFEDFTVGTKTFNYDEQMYNCSADEIVHKALSGSLVVNFKLFPFEEDEPTFSGLSYREYLEEYNNSVLEHNSNPQNDPVTVSLSATYFYDAVWAWAIALDNATKSNAFQIEQYRFDQSNNTALFEQFEQIDFKGVSGRIRFDRFTGSVVRTIDIFQVFNGTPNYVAHYTEGVLYTLSNNTVFIEDTFPIDLEGIHPLLVAFFLVILFIQVIVIIAIQITTIVYHNTKEIKASSPTITHLAYIGTYCIAMGMFLVTLDYYLNDIETGRLAVLCQAIWVFCFPFGFTLAYGTAAVKTWRLYRLFNHVFKPGRRFISQPALISYVCVLVAINVVISTLWTSIDPFINIFISTTETDASGNVQTTLQRTCDCTYFFVWFAVQWGYIFLLLAVLLTLVCLTRGIKRKSFQTVTLQVLVYGTTVTFGLGASLYYFAVFLRLSYNINYLILGIFINLVLLLYTTCAFSPPVILYIRQKRQKRQKRGQLIKATSHE